MVQLFEPPFTSRDARELTTEGVQRRSEVRPMGVV